MSPYSSNTSSSNPDIQQQYAQQQAEQRRAAQNPPVGAPPEQAPRMVQRNRQQQDAVRDEMDIDTGDDDVRAPKRKREEESEPMEGEDRVPKKIRLDPPPEAGPDMRVVARGDMAMPVPAIPTAPLTTEALKKAIRSEDLETVQHLLETGQIDLKKKLTDAHPLIVAIKCNCVAAIKLLLQAGAHINGCYRDGTTLLMSAVRYSNTKVIELLLEYGADIDATNDDEESVLMSAIQYSNTKVIKLLLEYGADINATDYYGQNALLLAAEAGNYDAVSLLLDADADIEASDDNGDTALTLAADNKEDKIFNFLIKKGANIHAQNNQGFTALSCQVKNGNVAMVKLLLTLGANINGSDEDGETILMLALRLGRDEVFNFLIEKRADIHAVDNEGETALTYAVKNGNVAMVEQLLTLGVNINASNNKGQTALMLAAERGHDKIFNLLIKKRADIHATDLYLGTVLMHAIKGGSETIMDTLVTLGADIHTRDSIGKTALTHAIDWGRVEMLRLLLVLRVNVNTADRNGMTPLMEAARRGEADMFRLLFDAGADIFAVDHSGQTVMMHAVMGGEVWVVKKLLDVASNIAPDIIDAVNRYGDTPLMLAAYDNKLDILKLLLERGAQVNLRGTQAKNATVTAIKREKMPVLELLLAYGGEPHDMQGAPSPLLGDMFRHRALLKPGFVADAVTLEALYGSSLSSLPHINSNTTVSAELVKIGEAMQICSPITLLLNEQLHASDKLWQVLASTGSALSAAQKTSSIAGLLIGLGVWIQSWSPGWNPYQGNNLSTQVEANLVALVKLQVEKLVALGEQMEMTVAVGLETLLPQCVKYTQVKNGELVVDDVGLMAHLTGQLGLYGPLADQVAAAWFTTVNQQQAIILASSLFRSVFDEQASESEAGQVLLAAFGVALKQINTVAGGTLLRSSTLQGEPAGLYADLMFRQLHMLMQYADQTTVAS